jgi:2-dehydro-3-deoxygalactonokinase
MKKFISCDWGTSAFRLRLAEAETNKVVSEIKSEEGIASTYKLWTDCNTDVDRFSFYRSILSKHIATLEQESGSSLENIPVVISGMASASIGMIELPYKELPFQVDGYDLLTHTTEPSGNFKHKIIFISGARSSTDVMRGEETILTGCDTEYSGDEQLFIFPGTHSKHIMVRNRTALDLKTYMTGEVFDLLCNKSVLSASVEMDNRAAENGSNPNFIKGVIEGAESNLLHSIFSVRTNQLFKKLNRKENYHYLSGLLIGAELRDLLQNNFLSVTLASNDALSGLYLQALHALGINKHLHRKNSDEALIKGQSVIFRQLHNNL